MKNVRKPALFILMFLILGFFTFNLVSQNVYGQALVPTSTFTPVPPTNTPPPTPTFTPILPTNTPPPTPTFTPILPTNTSTPTSTFTPILPTNTSTPTSTFTPILPTNTSTPTSTFTPILPTNTPTPTSTFTPIPPTPTDTPTPADLEPPVVTDVQIAPGLLPVNNSDPIVLSADVDDTQTGGSPIQSAAYTMDDGNTWTAMLAGDGSFDTAFEGVITTVPMPVEPGVYAICVRGTDSAGNTSAGNDCTMLVVYDMSSGFVTGGGWIDSPAGAYEPNPTLIGKATFGFVSKYRKGAKAPTGNTEFAFHAADLNFHSSSYEWLVVTGSDYAKFKGTGTINGVGEFKFMLWAGDSEPDTFRIKIWWEEGDTEHVVYDNGMKQTIGGGNIVVQSKKK